VTLADGCLSQEGAEFKDGKWVLPDGTPTFHVCHKDDKYVVDWATYNGYRRYHGECHVCHGPNGLGSTYAPALAHSLQTMDYGTFLGTVASGRTRDEAGTKFVMPAFGDNKNVMCFINDLYVYLKARSFEAPDRAQRLCFNKHMPRRRFSSRRHRGQKIVLRSTFMFETAKT